MMSDQSQNIQEETNKDDVASSPAPRGRAPRGRNPAPKPRRKARPYKRMPQETLSLRVRDMKKKLSVLQSKTVLIEDRLGMHEEEIQLRLEEETTSENK